MTKFEFIDVEAVWDEHLHEAYREIDPRGAAMQKRNDTHRHRIPCKRVIAAAAFSIELDECGAISIGGLKSWTKHEHGDEREVVANLFAHLRERPEARVVTYAGLAAEVPLLTLAAMQYQLALPDQLRTGLHGFNRPGAWRPHIDLALELKGQGRDWAHLSELGLRLGLPPALFTGKPDIEQPVSGEQWQALRQRVNMDCVITGMIALSFWRAGGRVRLDQVAMLHNLADWCVRSQAFSDAHTDALIHLRSLMFEGMAAGLNATA